MRRVFRFERGTAASIGDQSEVERCPEFRESDIHAGMINVADERHGPMESLSCA